MSFSLEQAVAAGTLVTGLTTAYVAYQQYRSSLRQEQLERSKHIANLFERRFEIFKAAQNALSKVMADASTEYGDVVGFDKSVQQSYFLFDDFIFNYMKDIRANLLKLASAVKRLRDDKVSEENRKKAIEEEDVALSWLLNELKEDGLFLKFKAYLRH